MALSGVHIVCGFSASDSNNSSKQPLFGSGIWSETMMSAGTTARSASSGANSNPIFRVDSSAEIYAAVGKSPNASNAVSVDGRPETVRHHIYPGIPYDIPANVGDSLAWVLA